jgi:hypothetical protein
MLEEDNQQNIARMTPTQLRQRRLDDMRDVLRTDQGKRVIWDILEQTGLMSSVPFSDLAQLSRAEGKRDLGVNIHDWVMQAAPGTFLKMLENRAQEMEKN